jgi:hypothetical protein
MRVEILQDITVSRSANPSPNSAVRILCTWFLSSLPFLFSVIFVCDSVLQTRKFFPQNILETDKTLKSGELDSVLCRDA